MWNEQTAEQLGAALRRLRNDSGLSQEALAYQAGITKNQLQLIEAGRSTGRKEGAGPSNPRMATLVGLSGVLGISVAQLMTESGL